LRNDGIEMIAPHRSNRSKPPTQDRRRLSRYMRCWLVERFFAWMQWQRRILGTRAVECRQQIDILGWTIRPSQFTYLRLPGKVPDREA
jgi:hypothetical protein